MFFATCIVVLKRAWLRTFGGTLYSGSFKQWVLAARFHHVDAAQVGQFVRMASAPGCIRRADLTMGMLGFHFRRGGGSIEPSKTGGGGGVREKGSIDRHH